MYVCPSFPLRLYHDEFAQFRICFRSAVKHVVLNCGAPAKPRFLRGFVTPQALSKAGSEICMSMTSLAASAGTAVDPM